MTESRLKVVTISLLPSFVHRHRHYTLGTQEAVIEARVREGQPWSRAGPASEPHNGPCLRTRQRWVKAFHTGAPLWLGAMQVLPATHAQQDDVFACMLAAAKWLARGRDVWQTVWCWGWNTGHRPQSAIAAATHCAGAIAASGAASDTACTALGIGARPNRPLTNGLSCS